MSMTSTTRAAAAALTVACCIGTAQALPASAATPACGASCVSVFSSALGTATQPNFVEAIIGNDAVVGRLVGLKRASSADSSEDIMARVGSVSQFHDQGLVSAEIDAQYGGMTAAQLQYAPLGMATGLCVGVAQVAYQGEPLTLQPCTIPGLTVFILGTPDAAGSFPILSASTSDFRRPFAMTYPRHVDTAADTLPPIVLRHLRFHGREQDLRATQLWGVYHGVIQQQ